MKSSIISCTMILFFMPPIYGASQGAGAGNGNTPPDRRLSMLSAHGAVAHMSGLRNRKKSHADEQNVDLVKTLLSVSPPEAQESILLVVKDEGTMPGNCPHGLPAKDKCPICG